MRKLLATLLAGLSLTTSLPALAEPFGDRHGREERHFRQDYYRDRPAYREHHSHHGLGWGILGAGLALGAIALAAEAPRPAVVVPAPAPAPIAGPPARAVWYFCGSAGAYYPYVNYCPEGWRAVPATPY